MTRVTLLTDFGTADGYAAAMKGVIAAISPDALIDDAAHDVPPGDVEAGAWAISRYWRLYPPGTVHVIVVDPGVGSARRALAARADDRLLVAPDNGVLTRVLAEAGSWTAADIQERRFLRLPLSHTFHGRDVFAPAGAHLARGVPLERLGPPLTDPVRIPLPEIAVATWGVTGIVVHVDRFGNLVTNIPETRAATGAIEVAGHELGSVRRTYADARPGEALALIGSAGVLEISVRDGSAARSLACGRGAPVTVRYA